ncbi:MAG: hypothetical protein ACRDZ5_07830 [Acidimicrobiales bacterium]
MLERLGQLDSVRVVLHLDELQELAGFTNAARLTKAMRAALSKAPSVTTIFSGSQEHMLRDLLTPRQRAFYGWGTWIRPGAISTEDWAAGLASRFEKGGFSATASAIDRLLQQSEGHARSTMLVAQQTAIVAALEQERAIEDWMVSLGVERAMAADYGLHTETLVELRQMGRHVPATALRIAAGAAPYGGKPANPSSTQRAVEALERSGLIERRGRRGTGGWVVVDPLIRRFLAGV